MSRRRGNNGNGVCGPNSALSEFLNERGINAASIRRRAIAQAEAEAAEYQRAQAAHEADPESVPAPLPRGRYSRNPAAPATSAASAGESSTSAAAAVSTRAGTKGKGKGKEKTKKRKKDDSDADDDDDDNWEIMLPAAGQIAFCAECDSRFTVTAYSKASGDGDGLLCNPCGRKMARQDKETGRGRKRPAVKRVKRVTQSQAMDGETTGPKSLKEYCIRLVAKYIDDVEALGDMSQTDMDSICQIISRNRSLNNNTIRLFLEQQEDSLNLYDCARVDANELHRVGTNVPGLKHLSLHHAGRMTNEVLCHYAEKLPRLESLHIRGAFLVSREAYINYFTSVGHRLKSLTLASTARVNLDVIKAIVEFCPNLETLNLSNLTNLDNDCVFLLRYLTQLKSLDISFAGGDIVDETIEGLLGCIGSGLEELNLAGNRELAADSTSSIKTHCCNLRILNLSECELLTDEDILLLFRSWRSNHGLQELYLARLSNIQNGGLQAVVEHSGQTLKILDINSCTDIDHVGLMMVLEGCKKLQKFDAAFVRGVDDEVVEAMQSAGIKRLAVWGCTKVTEVCKVKQGVSIIGRESDIVAR